jgi:HEAT repeat protein
MVIVDLFKSRPDVEALKTDRNVKGLVRALNYRRDSETRAAAAIALGRMADATAIAPLIQALEDKYVRWEAAAALERIGEPAVDWLNTAANGNNVYVRKVAQIALERIQPN